MHLGEQRNEQVGHTVAFDHGDDSCRAQQPLQRRPFKRRAKPRNRHERTGAASRETLDRFIPGRHLGRGLQRIVDTAAARGAADACHDVAITGVDRVSGAKRARELQPFWNDIDRNDGGAAGDPRGHHGRQAHTAGTEHRQRRSRSCPQGIQHRAGTGLHAAAQRRRELERQGVRQAHDIALRRQRMSGERRLLEERAMDSGALRIAQRGRSVGARPAKLQFMAVFAVRRFPLVAPRAMAA